MCPFGISSPTGLIFEPLLAFWFKTLQSGLLSSLSSPEPATSPRNLTPCRNTALESQTWALGALTLHTCGLVCFQLGAMRKDAAESILQTGPLQMC